MGKGEKPGVVRERRYYVGASPLAVETMCMRESHTWFDPLLIPFRSLSVPLPSRLRSRGVYGNSSFIGKRERKRKRKRKKQWELVHTIEIYPFFNRLTPEMPPEYLMTLNDTMTSLIPCDQGEVDQKSAPVSYKTLSFVLVKRLKVVVNCCLSWFFWGGSCWIMLLC